MPSVLPRVGGGHDLLQAFAVGGRVVVLVSYEYFGNVFITVFVDLVDPATNAREGFAVGHVVHDEHAAGITVVLHAKTTVDRSSMRGHPYGGGDHPEAFLTSRIPRTSRMVHPLR